jgi:hypothetical protein
MDHASIRSRFCNRPVASSRFAPMPGACQCQLASPNEDVEKLKQALNQMQQSKTHMPKARMPCLTCAFLIRGLRPTARSAVYKNRCFVSLAPASRERLMEG